MLDIVLKVLCILGIALLVLLCVLLVLLLIVLFFPVRYWVNGKKDEDTQWLQVKARWLFGLLRIRFLYPKPGNVVVKLLWFTVYDSAAHKAEGDTKSEIKTDNIAKGSINTSDVAPASEQAAAQDSKQKNEVDADDNPTTSHETVSASDTVSNENVEGASKENFFSAKYKKIKYTIQKIYDKIKYIWENIAFYKDLFLEEETQGLLHHAFSRLGKILKSIQPRKLKADVLFGTGSPDTTGYAFAVYGMFSPKLGKSVYVTPDFTQAILQGELYAAGHIAVFQLLYNSLRVVLDKRLRLLISKIKKHNNKA